MMERPHKKIGAATDDLLASSPECPGQTFKKTAESVHELGFRSPCHSRHKE